MEYNRIKEVFNTCGDLVRLDGEAKAILFWTGKQELFDQGRAIYTEGAKLDDTFYLLLEGTLKITEAGKTIGEFSENRVFGEAAFFTNRHERIASISVESPKATVLQLRLTSENLKGTRFAPLQKCLGTRAWERLVSDSQNAV